MSGQPHFAPALFQFLRQLRTNNNREWFQANAERFEGDVRGPMLHFVADFGPSLEQFAPAWVADPRPTGGSTFRIHRDVRFSKDKTPYKTWIAAQFRHERGRDVHAPGFYLHLEPGNVFGGFGMWHPDSETLSKIRSAIVDDPDGWKRAISARSFTKLCRLEGDSLKRPPIGYDPDHPLIEHLKRRDFIARASFTESDACAPEFLERFASASRAAAPLVRFLTASISLHWR